MRLGWHVRNVSKYGSVRRIYTCIERDSRTPPKSPQCKACTPWSKDISRDQIERSTRARCAECSAGVGPFFIADFHTILPVCKVDFRVILYWITFSVAVGGAVLGLLAEKQFAHIELSRSKTCLLFSGSLRIVVVPTVIGSANLPFMKMKSTCSSKVTSGSCSLRA